MMIMPFNRKYSLQIYSLKVTWRNYMSFRVLATKLRKSRIIVVLKTFKAISRASPCQHWDPLGEKS